MTLRHVVGFRRTAKLSQMPVRNRFVVDKLRLMTVFDDCRAIESFNLQSMIVIAAQRRDNLCCGTFATFAGGWKQPGMTYPAIADSVAVDVPRAVSATSHDITFRSAVVREAPVARSSS